MTPIRLAVVADVLLGPMAGVPRSVIGITHELAALDPARLELTMVSKRRPSTIAGLQFARSRSPRVPRVPDQLLALQRPFTLRGYDLIHYMDSRPPLDYGLGRTPKVVTQHGFAALIFDDEYYGRLQKAVNESLRRVARYADLTFTCSESERQELLKLTSLEPAKVVPIHHGVDHDRFYVRDDPTWARREVVERFGLDGRYVLYVSNHQRKKNTERLVEAFARVAAVVPDVTLVLTGWQTPRFRLVEAQIERLGISSRVHVLGHVPDDALPPLYGAADLFALPSLHEGFGIPLLEAMASGTPVLASNVYALPEVCGEAAVLVDPYDVDAIADGMRRVLEQPEVAADLRRRGLERAALFTWRRSAEQHLEQYERLLSPRRR